MRLHSHEFNALRQSGNNRTVSMVITKQLAIHYRKIQEGNMDCMILKINQRVKSLPKLLTSALSVVKSCFLISLAELDTSDFHEVMQL